MCVDRLSKMAQFITIVTTKQTSRLLIDFVCKHQGLLRKLVSNRDTRFTSVFGLHCVMFWAQNKLCL